MFRTHTGRTNSTRVCIDKSFRDADILSVGLYLQKLVLLLTEGGLDSCIAAGLTGYADIINAELAID